MGKIFSPRKCSLDVRRCVSRDYSLFLEFLGAFPGVILFGAMREDLSIGLFLTQIFKDSSSLSMKEIAYPIGLLDLTEGELLYLVGENLSKLGGGGALALDDFGEIMSRAKNWFEEHTAEFKSRICSHPVVLTILTDKELNTKRVILFLTIADLVSDAKCGVSPFVIASLIVQHGLAEFCEIS